MKSIVTLVFGCFLVSGSVIDQNFQDGSIEPWMDETGKWRVEDSTTNPQSPAPPSLVQDEENLNKFLRFVQSPGEFGPAPLTSPKFIAIPGHVLSFSFWIRSRHPKFNNLELYLANNQGEERPLINSLYTYSNHSNFKWESVSVKLPVTENTESYFVFYGYCGCDPLDGLAIDDILLLTGEDETPTTSTLETTQFQTTVPSTTLRTNPTSIRATTTLAPTTTTRPEPETCDDFHNEGDKGTISSPHYPGYYGYEITCQYFLQVSKNKVRLQFDSVNIDLPLTSLKVYDGHSTDGQILREYPGYQDNDNIPIWSNGNKMLVVFSSDSRDAKYKGWEANYASNPGGGPD